MKRVLIIAGTRPEAIKVAPIILAGRDKQCGFSPIVCLTGQHPRIAQEAFDVFGIVPDIRLDCVPPGGDLCKTTASVVRATGRLIDDCRPDAVLVQGDTISAMAGGLAACLRQVPLAHVEAGLRSGHMDDPFPEELSRRQISHMATWNFTPTQAATANLTREGIDPRCIRQVGNTVIDAIRIVRSSMKPLPESEFKTILVTAHRRENWGAPMQRICDAIHELARRHADWRFVFSVHPNPKLLALAHREFDGKPSVELLWCPAYDAWVRQLVRCDLILTDSGGMQEEGCSLGRPVVVLRKTTERPEAIEAGSAVLAGTETHNIIDHAERIMSDADVYARMAQPREVFGDGHASERIIAAMCNEPEPAKSAPALAVW